MPVRCDLSIQNLPQHEFALLDYAVMKHAFDSHNELGRLAEERIYSTDLVARLIELNARREVKIELSYADFVKDLFLDLVVDRRAVYEFKTAATLNSQHRVQLITYLYLLDLEHGKLLNFRTKRIQTEFVNAVVPRTQRCKFDVVTKRYTGSAPFRDLTVELLRDWGTCLAMSLYRDCISWLVGNRTCEPCLLPLTRRGQSLGNQPFWLVADGESFDVTTFSQNDEEYERQLSHLLLLSGLQAIHRVNIDTHTVTFSTIRRT